MAKLWDVATGQAIRTFTGYTDLVLGVTFSPDGKYALTGSSDHTAKLWDVATSQELRTFVGHTDQVWCVAFSLDGKSALTGSIDYRQIMECSDRPKLAHLFCAYR